jgi:uncharacterized membrane-anchored protein
VTARRIKLALFVALAIVQLAVAAGAIIRSEVALRSGEVYRFRLQPVDPVDAFRGRYVALRFVLDRAPVDDGTPSLRPQKICVPLTVDDEGFARFGPVSLEPPAAKDYLRLRSGVDFIDDSGDRMVSVALPFRRYYMPEELAREVDRSMWRRGRRPAWVTVRVWGGVGVIQELWIDGVPVREWLAGDRPGQPPETES